MIRHWRQSTFLLLALFALVACSGAAPEVESALVEVPSATPIPPTSSPEPSATPLPTETATFTPTPQPSPTRPEPSHTPAPTDIPATPTPEGPETYGLVFPQATEAEIEAALNAMSHQNTWPVFYRSDLGGYLFNAILANVRFIEPKVLSDGTTLTLEGTIYFKDESGMTQGVGAHLMFENPSTGNVRLARYGRPLDRTVPEFIEGAYGGILSIDTLVVELVVSIPRDDPDSDPMVNLMPPEFETPDQFLRQVYKDLGFSADQVTAFFKTGDPGVLPHLDGVPILPFKLFDVMN